MEWIEKYTKMINAKILLEMIKENKLSVNFKCFKRLKKIANIN